MFNKNQEAVTLSVNATDPDDDPLSYSYSTTGGEIFGQDNVVAWRLADQPFGKYSATVKVVDSTQVCHVATLALVRVISWIVLLWEVTPDPPNHTN